MREFEFWPEVVFTIICVIFAIIIMLYGCADWEYPFPHTTRSTFTNRLIKVNNLQEAETNCK